MSSFPNQAETYARVNVDSQQKWFTKLLSAVKIAPGSKCLDIGCGTGNNTVLLADIVGQNGHVVGIDPDMRRIEVANDKFKRVNIDYISGKSIDIPTCESGYDLIVSNVAMHWVNYEEKIETYRRVFSALRQGGVFASSEAASAFEGFHEILSFCTDEERNRFRDVAHFLTVEENREIFQNLGFEIVQIEKVIEESTNASLASYLEWFGATVHGMVDPVKIYDENRDRINIKVNKDGSVTVKRDINYITVKKGI